MKPPKLFRIPAGTLATTCTAKDCGAVIYKVDTGRSVQPLRVEPMMRYAGEDHSVDGVRAPTATEDGAGYSHFIDCTNASSFRRDNR